MSSRTMSVSKLLVYEHIGLCEEMVVGYVQCVYSRAFQNLLGGRFCSGAS